MLTAKECREKADTLRGMAVMFPEKAPAYAEAERRWRRLERLALDMPGSSAQPSGPAEGRL